MSRRVWTPRAQLLPTDVIISDPLAPDPDALVEVDRTTPDPAPAPEVDTPPPDSTTGALVTVVLALADAVADPGTGQAATAKRTKVREARQALADATGQQP